MNNTDFPEQIRSARKILGITQTEFADKFGVQSPSVSYWEHGKRRAPYEVLSYVLKINEEYEKCPKCRGKGYVKVNRTNTSK